MKESEKRSVIIKRDLGWTHFVTDPKQVTNKDDEICKIFNSFINPTLPKSLEQMEYIKKRLVSRYKNGFTIYSQVKPVYDEKTNTSINVISTLHIVDPNTISFIHEESNQLIIRPKYGYEEYNLYTSFHCTIYLYTDKPFVTSEEYNS